MNILVIHGEDVKTSYARLTALKNFARKKSWPLVILDDNSDIYSAFLTDSMFEKKRFFIVENLKKIKTASFFKNLKKCKNLRLNLVIYEKGLLTKSFLQKLDRPIKIEEYKIPKIIYKFLEAFRPGSSETCIKLLEQIVQKESPEYVIGFLARHLKDLYIVKNDSSGLSYPSWRLNKLKNQAFSFTLAKLKKIINKLARIDIEGKTSKINSCFLLELLIVKELS